MILRGLGRSTVVGYGVFIAMGLGRNPVPTVVVVTPATTGLYPRIGRYAPGVGNRTIRIGRNSEAMRLEIRTDDLEIREMVEMFMMWKGTR